VNWPTYNQSLVRRGDEILLGFDVIDNWDTELKEMNKDKVGLGARFIIPIPFFFYLVMLKQLHLPYRQTKEGIAQEDMLKEK
jgi:hypothetical protein